MTWPNRRDFDTGLALAENGPKSARVGILLLNMGGPDRLESVEPFLLNIFGDRNIIQLPGGRLGQFLLSRVIVKARLKEVKERYGLIGSRSPILHWTRIQMEGLQELLNERMPDPPQVGMAMRYWHPFADEGLRGLAGKGVERVVSLTLYPQYTFANTKNSEEDLLAARTRTGLSFPISSISEWYDHTSYLDLWARKIHEALENLDADVRDRVQLVVSAHGLPQEFVDLGDPYVNQIRSTMRSVIERIPDCPDAHLCFQSRAGPVKWIGPSTEETIRKLAGKGHDALLVWPIAFVSDHIETSFEVDMLFREEALKAGVKEFHRVETFNADPSFFEVLAELALGHLKNLGNMPVR